MIFQLTSICLLANHVIYSLEDQQFPVISVPGSGLIRGKVGKSYFTERKIYEFLGISYAKPPSNERRFKPPEEAGPWTGTYNATKMRQRCPQVEMAYYPSPDPDQLDTKEDIEDCLVLNIFTPNINSNTMRYPVMFYIHGGSFHLGSAYDFRPDFLLEEDILLVVVQYRLGPLGFLSLNTNEIPGNMGMLDILLALRWVKKNIRYFGGDPSEVTVVGQSAGAAAASALLISPLVEKGLYSQMIIQSGSILGSWTVDKNPIQSARSIAKILGCPTDNTAAMTSCLKAAPPLDLVKAHAKYINEDIISGGRGLGGCSLVVQPSSKFLDKDPTESFAEGLKMKVPLMGGTTRDEGTSFLASFYDVLKLAKITDGSYFQRNVTRDLLKFLGYEDIHGVLNDAYRNLYFGNDIQQLQDMYPGLVDISGVLLLKQSTYDVVRSMSYVSRSYAYSFNFYGGVSKLRASEPQWDKEYPFPAGVAHSDELGYLFPSSKHNYSERELNVVRQMTKFWTNFVKYGTPVTIDSKLKWPAMSTAYGPYLRISDVSSVRNSFLDEFTVVSRNGFLSGSSPAPQYPLKKVLFGFIICLILFR